MEILQNSIIFSAVEKTHWLYYLELENEFLSTKKYVEFTEENNETYSLEFMKLLLAVCSEIDIFCKILAGILNPAFNPGDRKNDILKWWYEIQGWYQSIPNKKVIMCNILSFEPWNGFESEQYIDKKGVIRYRNKKNTKSPTWWKDYNSVKHGRTLLISSKVNNYSKANLQNVCNAISALYIVEKNCLVQLGNEQEKAYLQRSKLFENSHHPFVDNETLYLD